MPPTTMGMRGGCSPSGWKSIRRLLTGGSLKLQIAHTPAPKPNALPDPAAYVLICLIFSPSLTTNLWAFYRVTGDRFNPAVTLALWLCGGMSTIRSIPVIPPQLIAGIAAASVVSALYPGTMDVETVLGGSTSISQGLLIEMFLMAQLVFVIFMLAVEKQRFKYLAPVGIGILFFLTGLSSHLKEVCKMTNLQGLL